MNSDLQLRIAELNRDLADADVVEANLRADMKMLLEAVKPLTDALAERACAASGQKTWQNAQTSLWPNHVLSIQILASKLFPLLQALASTEKKY